MAVGMAGVIKAVPEVEGYLFVAQEQATITNVMNNKIFKLSVSPLCRLCHSADEVLDHLISSCSYINQTQYKKRSDLRSFLIHSLEPSWILCL